MNCCYICGRSDWVECHHVFGGPNRKHSEAYGMKVFLCKTHHDEAHEGRHLAKALKASQQKRFEEQHSRERFMEIFGRNYL